VLLPNSSDPHEAVLDPLGVLLAVLAVGGLLYGIIEGPETGWTAPLTLATIVGGTAMLAAFVAWELRNPHPMLDVRLFKERAFSVGSSTITLQFFAMYGLYFAVTQYLQISHGYSPLRAALAAVPIGIVGMVAAPMSATFVRRFGHRRVVGSGLILSAIGLALMGGVTPTTSYVLILVGFLAMGFGNGQTTAPSTTLIMSSVPRAKSGVGSAVNDLSRELGGALGIAVLGSIMSSVYRSDIGHHLPAHLAAKAGTSIDVTLRAAAAAHDRADGQALHHAAQVTFAHGFGVAMLLGAVVLLANSALVWVRAVSVHPHGPQNEGHTASAAPAAAAPAAD
jgi:predicted MFS family arabinose efflux permease